MKIAISATNPCHLYDLAKEWHALGVLGAFHSGYPGWRLQPPSGFPLRAHSIRTILTYAALRLPRSIRPDDDAWFAWQDAGFDRAVGKCLRHEDGELIHALPGQALKTFKRARKMGIETCLNHASGPIEQQHAIITEANARLGLPPPAPLDPRQIEQRAQESALADWHCVASSVVKAQLIDAGIAKERIWVAPYGANRALFHPPTKPRIHGHKLLFAGQITSRKGLPVLFQAMQLLKALPGLSLDCYGPHGKDADRVRQLASSDNRIRFHAPVDQATLGERMRTADLLVLPSWEEAFGLVVPQALNCAFPVIVSDRVGAKDLIHQHENGSIFPAGDAAALAVEIDWWLNHREVFRDSGHPWSEPARSLLNQIKNRARVLAP